MSHFLLSVVLVVSLTRRYRGRSPPRPAPGCPPRLWPRPLGSPALLFSDPGEARSWPCRWLPPSSCSLASRSRSPVSSSILGSFLVDRFLACLPYGYFA